ncbi:Hypothetical protein, putative, partial [Bodo saltans]
MNSEFQHERHHQQLRSRSPRLVNVASSGGFGSSSLAERCSRSGEHPTPLDQHNATTLSRRGSHIIGGGEEMPHHHGMNTIQQPTRFRSPVVMLEGGGEPPLPLDTLLPSATFLSAGRSGASVPPPPPTIHTDNPSYRSIYASRCAASLGDSPNAIDPRHRGMSSNGVTIPSTSMNHHYVSAAEGMHGGASHASTQITSATATSMPQRSSSSMGSAHYQHPRQGPHQQQQRWHASMEHNPTKVLGAPGLVDDAYSQCMSWGSERLAGLLNDQFLLFDVSRPTEVCAAYKLGTPDGSYGHSTTTVTESA